MDKRGIFLVTIQMPREQEIKQKYFNYAWIQVDLSNFELHQIAWTWIHVALLYTLLKAKTFSVFFFFQHKSIDGSVYFKLHSQFSIVFYLSSSPVFRYFILQTVQDRNCTHFSIPGVPSKDKAFYSCHTTIHKNQMLFMCNYFHLPWKTFSDHIYHIRLTQYILHFTLYRLHILKKIYQCWPRYSTWAINNSTANQAVPHKDGSDLPRHDVIQKTV